MLDSGVSKLTLRSAARMSSPQEKRTTTQPGLGQQADARRTTTREREAQKPRVEESDPESRPAQSRRPTKGGPPEPRRNTSSRGLPAVEAPAPKAKKTQTPRGVPKSRTPAPASPRAVPKPSPERGRNQDAARSMPRYETPPGSPKTETRRRSLSDRRAITIEHVGPVLGRASNAEMLTGRAIPRIVKSKAEIAAAPIDNRAGFLLAYIDGSTTVQGLVDIDVMAETEVHEIVHRLRLLGIVAIR